MTIARLKIRLIAFAMLACGFPLAALAQDRAMPPDEAAATMKLPPGFKAELVASEPDLVNPTAFTFDDRGRIWVTESVEYPRQTPGQGFDVRIAQPARVHAEDPQPGQARTAEHDLFAALVVHCFKQIPESGVTHAIGEARVAGP